MRGGWGRERIKGRAFVSANADATQVGLVGVWIWVGGRAGGRARMYIRIGGRAMGQNRGFAR